jgi:hypothetical protein
VIVPAPILAWIFATEATVSLEFVSSDSGKGTGRSARGANSRSKGRRSAVGSPFIAF